MMVAVRACDVKPGDMIRPPEGAVAHRVKCVASFVDYDGANRVKLSVGWGSVTLDWHELVDKEGPE